MLELIQHFEQVASQFRPIVLIVPGVSAVLLGLFTWLGGLAIRRVLVASVGAVTGAVCGFFLGGWNIIFIMVSTGLGAGVAIMFEKIFIIILTAAIAVLAGFFVSAWPYLENAGNLEQFPEQRTPDVGQYFAIHQLKEIATEYVTSFSSTLRQICSQMPLRRWAMIAALGVTFIAAGLFLWRITSALCLAASGTTFIFAGMISLLLYKGSQPLSSIYRSASFYAAVFAAMITFGTIEQLLLCHLTAKKEKTEICSDKKTEDNEVQKKLDWRLS
ncbi:MAG: hypothetical protein JSV82_04875 [Planctomycetota bacterium]|nr:MAG: hypothetical protein JSV82_04875 [Planctomycetota bacterium]